MKAISIREPWLFLILRPDIIGDEARREAYANGEIKDVENRTRLIRFSGEVLLHASKSPADDYRNLQLHYWNEKGIRIPDFKELQTGGIRARAMFELPVDESESEWFTGPFAYPIFSVEPVRFTPLKGALGFFNLPDGFRLQ